MITFFILTFILLLLFRNKETLVLSKERCDFLKAFFPFLIIAGHCSFFCQNTFFDDIRWSGPYIVVIFFFISGYGLQYKYRHNQMDIKYLKNRTKAILLPIILPIIIYVLLSCNGWGSFKHLCKNAIFHGNLILPYSWFVIVILLLYVSYYFIRRHLKNEINFCIAYCAFLLVITVIFQRIGWDSSSFVSNIAFLLGIVYYDNESKILRYINNLGGVKQLLIIIMGCICLSYIHNSSLFPGFAFFAVPFWTIAFIGLFSTINVKSFKLAKLLKKYSYEIYLTQGISFSILSFFELNNWCFLILSLILSLVLGTISQKVTLAITHR